MLVFSTTENFDRTSSGIPQDLNTHTNKTCADKTRTNEAHKGTTEELHQAEEQIVSQEEMLSRAGECNINLLLVPRSSPLIQTTYTMLTPNSVVECFKQGECAWCIAYSSAVHIYRRDQDYSVGGELGKDCNI